MGDELSPTETEMSMSPTMGIPSGGEHTNVKVMVRVRPFNKREIAISEKTGTLLRPCVRMRDNTCAVLEYTVDDKGFTQEKEREAFQFDECFWSMPMDQGLSTKDFADQKHVYECSGLLAMQSAFGGFNVCIFAYGQTGSGKTYSMLGAPKDEGISPRLVDDLFQTIEEVKTTTPTMKIQVECMFYEIYNEKCRDLFAKKLRAGEYDNPKIRQHPTKGVFVEGLQRREVTTAEQAKNYIERGTKERAMAETKMNATSSRSHAVFQIQVTKMDAMKGTQTTASVNLVDLAGSEKIKMSGASGETLTEAKNINQSLSTLRKVIDTLIENSGIRNKKRHKVPPFRESVLTYVLSDSLGGNSKTQMIATVSPHESNMEDTLGTLRYALRAKAIVCNAKVNEEKSAAMLDSMRDEIMALQAKLRSPGAGGRGAVSEEIKREIKLREEEVKKMETNQVELENALVEAQRKEEELQNKLDEVHEQQAELQITIDAQKRERFAAAFRNAFMIQSDKKAIETSKAELDDLVKANNELKSQRDFLNAENSELQTKLEGVREDLDRTNETMTKELMAKEATINTLKRQLGAEQDQVGRLKTKIEENNKNVFALDNHKVELERRLQRMQEELLAVQQNLQTEKTEKAAQKRSFQDAEAAAAAEQENLRKRKDKYKQMYLEAVAKVEAKQTVLEAMQSDRAAFLQTIKAQQQMVEEQSSSVQRMATERKEAVAKSQMMEQRTVQREVDVQCMGEALREYQNAASEWMYENHAVSRELDRVKKGYNDLRGFVEQKYVTAGSPGGHQGSPSPNRAKSPSRVMSPSSSVGRPSVHHVDPARRNSPSRPRSPVSRNGGWRSPGNSPGF